ncbi:glycosyltransferase family 4 protein [Roseofilum capinflatum]|uniref:Glycosyltransferase family 4 protein n=1 Tax=Roseofilum capinflatum BLCC-M114 TaxID=3022440 RepID=A0ABT7B2A5_9CYAN|nr:glycosyltransferase family 4 protein [Roseofilum capinflatum]MDJ1172686.1 glycosyltransferase family 4 protein [Roseofilum capinflatum BLCC-M114]
MRIAVIGAKGLPAKQGGIEHYCQELYPRMVSEGHRVDLFARSSYTEAPWFSSTKVKGVNVISLPSIALRGVDAVFNSALGAIATFLRPYDLVHIHALGPALFCWLPKLMGSTTVIVTCHGLDWQRSKWGAFSSRLIHLGEKMAVCYADEITVVSQALQDYFKATYGIITPYIPNAPATYLASDPHSTYLTSLKLDTHRYILFLGRLVPEKRPDLLIKAYLSLQHPPWRLVIAGGGCHTAEYTQHLEKLAGHNPNIVFTGEVRGQQLADLVRGASLFVLPSDLEGLPLVMLEAMQEGIPVLASDIEAHEQLVGGNEERGLLFPVGDIQECAQKLEYAISHPEQIQNVAKIAQTYIKTHYNWQNITYEKLKLYNRVVTSRPMVESFQQRLWQRNPLKIPRRIDPK